MGLFDSIGNHFKIVESAPIIKGYLERYDRADVYDLDKLSISLIDSAFDTNSDELCGKYGQRPHKITLALVSMLLGTENHADPIRGMLILSSTDLLNHISQNLVLYPFSALDYLLIENSKKVLEHVLDVYEDHDDSPF